VNPDLIHEAVRARAAEHPDALALVHRDVLITYGTLDALSDRLAASFGAAGIGCGAVVPVLLPPSPRLVIVLLAILKCGAAYAALDPSWPADRLHRIDALLAGQVAVTGPEQQVFARRLVVDGYTVVGSTVVTPPPAVTAGDAAMVFFTSGSTGEAKAVLSPHRGTTRLFHDCTFGRFDRTTVMSQSAAVPWDAFALELWGVLLTGGTSVLVDERPLTPAGLREVITRYGVNTVFLTTSLCHLVVEEDLGAFAGLRTVMAGGEKLSAWHAGQLLAAHPHVRLVNGYGPVEGTVFALTHDVRPADTAGDIPLGVPVPRTEVVVLEGGRRCAPGEVGELCVAGDGLALGYLGDPVLTAERFVVLDLDGVPTRLYRTGDLGSVGADGVFWFHGRADRQVKVRGHRIEPSGIEHVAAGLPGVRRCVVVPVPDAAGYCESLALFFTGTSPRLVEQLSAVLPAYSVPYHVVPVDAFPLTGNGKLDTTTLLELLPPSADVAEPPGGGDEDAVAAEFGALLGLAEVDRSESFFALGGTSLTAVRLCGRLGARFGQPIPVSRLVRTPTVSAITEWLVARSVPVVSRGPDTSTPLTAMQHSFLVRHLVSGADPENHCLLAWTITGALDVDALMAAVRAVHARHGYLHARYQADEDAVAIASDRPAEFVHLVADELDDAVAVLDIELHKPFRLGDGPPWRAVLVRFGSRWLFGIAAHHIAFDGWSQHLLADDLSAAYAAGGPWSAVPTPADTMRILRELDEVADLPAQREYWPRALAGMPPLALPVPSTPRAGPRSVTSRIDEAALAGIDRRAHEHRTGRLAVLLAAVASTLAEHTGQADFGIGVPVTRRGTDLLQRPVGCLVDTVCVRLRPTVDILPRTAVAVREALANADVPFAEVARSAGGCRTGRHPLYQVIVAVQDSPTPVLRLGGCRVEPRDGHDLGWPMAELLVELLAAPGAPAGLRVSRDPARVDADTVHTVLDQVLARLGQGSS